ncbi:MAG: exonuclease SbcCD subunit D [Chloroflexi bacterium]|nr:exonuclease SbcCD subunit D [Anaerolineaceae bacterium]NMB90380.1 exonuclease SbcCD subunit D [Chloroflexota bacterium]
MLNLLHFADAHIDIASHGRHDPVSGLPVRVNDFLKSLDTIIDTAIEERVDLVLFAGDAYKDRTPVPTFQREWGRRIMRLSAAGIPTLLLVGNHDLSPASGRANALQEFETLSVPHVRLLSRPCFLGPDDLYGLPLQVLALPWVSRSSLMASLELSSEKPAQVYAELEARLSELVQTWLEEIDPSLPVVLTAHASVQGAKLGGERSVMLGSDLVLPGSLVRDPRLDYVALGHIHKAQDLNEGSHPPVIYPGSIERVDFGEAADEKYFVVAHVARGKTEVEWRKLDGRRFIDRRVQLQSPEGILQQLIDALPPQAALADAIVRLTVEYPRQWDNLLEEIALRQYAENAFEFHFVRRPQLEARIRLPGDQTISSLTSLDLLQLYWKSVNVAADEAEALQSLAADVISPDPERQEE